MSAPPPQTTGPVTSSGQPVYIPNLVHNNKSLYYVKSSPSSSLLSSFFPPPRSPLLHLSSTATALVAGATAGILGLTNLRGFAFFLVTSLAVGAAFSAVNGGGKRFFLKPSEALLAGTIGNAFSFVLAWTCAFHFLPCRLLKRN